MNYIVFNNQTSKEELLKYNIVISDNSIVEEGAKISHGVSVLGASWISGDSEIGCNSVIDSSVIKNKVHIQSSVITKAIIGEESTVGPFANIREGVNIGRGCRIGNFVEIKNSTLGDGTKVAHLTYIGDADIGSECNIGCGVVFCNYNGKIKQRSCLGNRVFVGSNVNIIAPVNIGDEAYIAAGSTINKDIDSNEFAIARARQENKKNFQNPYKKQ